ncbi:DNA topoisomerase, putative [Medicago truncatula]|uniref:DNA topoisomerase, putative n=2 Tax=Medicago truncatula TaxID=3880 RepID=A0A072V6X6_MEDTR|nr:DNA topoisomerase, putative [Medicago truncatula]
MVNIFDCYKRNPSLMECVKVDIDAKVSKVSIYIKGGGVPMVDNGDGVYDLKGSGYGSRLINIFSLEFITEAVKDTTKFKHV